jgi:tetratricopeptide (TPR) repeat protein
VSYSLNRIAYYRDRCRPPLTQKALAQTFGRHVNTIVLWEKRGAPSPANLLQLVAFFVAHGAISDEPAARQFWEVSGRDQFAIPPELAQLFAPVVLPRPEDMPTCQLPQPTSIPTPSLLPLHRNRLFVGRAAELLALAAALREFGATAAICGLGGVGKTQLACEFAHRYGQFFPGGVFWVSFGDPAALPTAVASCGSADHLALHPHFEALSLDQQVRLVLAAWRDPLPRLLIFDNCEDEALLARWRPPTGGCRVLVTSRRARWSAALISQTLPLRPLRRAESVALLGAYRINLPDAAQVLASPAARADLDAIAAELGDLPLALHLAGAYLAYHYLSPASYLAELRQGADQAGGALAVLQQHSLDDGDFSPTDHAPITHAFALTYQRLRPDKPTDQLALRLLTRAAHFAPGEPLPHTLLLATLPAQATGCEGATGEDALARLAGDLGLLELRDGSVLSIHRLVADFVRTVAADPEAQLAVEQIVLAEAQRLNHGRLPTPMLALQPHLRAVTSAAAAAAHPLSAELSAELGWHLVLLNAYDEGQRAIAHSLAIREATVGAWHPATADSLNLLGLNYQFQGAFVTARPLFERALAIWERAYGPDHADTATGCNNLGYLLLHLNEYTGAQAYLQRALRIYRRALGLKSVAVARTLNNLGYVMLQSGNYASAQRYLLLALAIREQILPAQHLSTAQTLNNLGEVRFARGDYAGACRYHEQALAMREAVFGANHFHAAESMRNLALALHAQGESKVALRHLECALMICETSLGERHIETAWKLESLGLLHYDQADFAAAQPYLMRALATYEELLPAQHPRTVRLLQLLAAIACG